MTRTKLHPSMSGCVISGVVIVSCPVRKWRKCSVTGLVAALEIKVIADLIQQPMVWSPRRVQPREERDGEGSENLSPWRSAIVLCQQKKGLVHQVGCSARE